jgi:hypothetical protein
LGALLPRSLCPLEALDTLCPLCTGGPLKTLMTLRTLGALCPLGTLCTTARTLGTLGTLRTLESEPDPWADFVGADGCHAGVTWTTGVPAVMVPVVVTLK